MIIFSYLFTLWNNYFQIKKKKKKTGVKFLFRERDGKKEEEEKKEGIFVCLDYLK